jgi:ATP-dependent Clp protease ATP-binding subunit ClpC
MTSNLGVREVDRSRRAIGFDSEHRQEVPFEQMTQEIQDALKKAFRPEFLNRIDETLVFNTLSRADSTKIADLMLSDLAQMAERAGVRVRFDASVKRAIVDIGWRRESGGRELRRAIKREIETPLTDLLLARAIEPGMTVRIRNRNKEFGFEIEPAAETAPVEETVPAVTT